MLVLRVKRVLILALLCGCAPIATLHTLPDGTRIVEINERCPTGAAACSVKVDYANFYDDLANQLHERDHPYGLQHGPWLRNGGEMCAKVLSRGKTEWTVGQLICRSNGTYYQRSSQ